MAVLLVASLGALSLFSGLAGGIPAAVAVSVTGNLDGTLCTASGGNWNVTTCLLPSGTTWNVVTLTIPCGTTLTVNGGASVNVGGGGTLSVCSLGEVNIEFHGLLQVGAGGVLSNNGTIVNVGNIVSNGGTINNRRNSVSMGMISNKAGASLILDGPSPAGMVDNGSLVNYGLVVVSNASLTVLPNAYFDNAAFMKANGSASSIVNQGRFANVQYLDLQGGSLNITGLKFANYFRNTGVIEIGPSAALNLDGGYLTNSGPAAIIINSGSLRDNWGGYFLNGAKVVSSGSLNVASGGYLKNTGKVFNTGTFVFSAGGIVLNTAAGTNRVIYNYGTITNNGGCVGGVIVPAPPTGFSGSFLC